MQKKDKDKKSGFSWPPPLVIGLLVLGLAVSSAWFVGREPNLVPLRYGEFKQVLQAPGIRVRNLRVGTAEIRGRIVTHDRISGAEPKPADAATGDDEPAGIPFRTSRTGLIFDEGLQPLLDQRVGAQYQGEEEDSVAKSLANGLVLFLMLGLMLGLSVFAFRWFSGAGSPFSFGRGRHKLYARKNTKTTFQDVAGIDEAKAELLEVVDFLKRPQKYQALGGRIPKGVLLVGPPGTGKTLLAKAVAGEAEVPFFSMSGSDFVEMFVGVGASRVRDLFRDAESKAPCIIFIDELDALGKSRGNNMLGGHDEREQTLNQLLVEMDGFDTNRGVILMAATNRPETLDAALLRPGRFDRTVVVDRPDIDGREAILKVHARNVKIAGDVDLRRVAALTPGSVGADLANLVNESALLAARVGKELVHMADFNEAVERGAVGLERKSRIMRADEKKRVAYHEAGHALVACALSGSDPVHKVSIIPRGVGVLGFVLQRPEDDRHLITQTELEGRIKVALGGTVAEELTFAEISTGAANDLEQANTIARRMVREFGMSRLGRIFLRAGEGPAFLPPGMMGDGRGDCSEETAREIDLEVRQMLDTATCWVRDLLLHSRPALTGVAERLIDKEVIDGPELLRLLTDFGFKPSDTARRGLLESPKPHVVGNGEP